MPMRRVFFALPPDPPLQAALGEVAQSVAATACGRASRAESIHLTLAFIGDVDDARLPALVAIGGGVEGAAFSVVLDQLGCFRRARIAWIAPSARAPALMSLQQALATALARAGFPAEARPFAPHVTLARHCTDMVDAAAQVPPLEWRADAFALWAAGGARYEELARWPLLTG